MFGSTYCNFRYQLMEAVWFLLPLVMMTGSFLGVALQCRWTPLCTTYITFCYMILNVVDLLVWCSVATAKAVIYINPCDVPVHYAVLYVTFTHLMPNICSPVVRKKRLIIILLSPSVFEMLDSVAFFLSCSHPFPHFTAVHIILVACGIRWFQMLLAQKWNISVTISLCGFKFYPA